MANVDILRSQDLYQGSVWHQNNVLSIITKYLLPLILENELKVIKINHEVTESSILRYVSIPLMSSYGYVVETIQKIPHN